MGPKEVPWRQCGPKATPTAAALVCGTPAAVSSTALLAPKDRSSLHLSPPGPNVGSGRPRLDTGSKSYHKMLSLQYPQGSPSYSS